MQFRHFQGWSFSLSLRAFLLSGLSGLGSSWLFGLGVQAQVLPDRTLPVPSQVVPGCVNCRIEGGTLQGNYLFHSFEQFSVPTNGLAWFNQPDTVQTILTRVTGPNLSTIDGLLKTNGTAQLFLINPNGIVFGANARLEIAGSFTATTASGVRLSNNTEFSAVNPQAPPLLTVDLNPGLQLATSRSGSTILTQSPLSTGQDLVLAADIIRVQGPLQAGGNLSLNANSFLQVQNAALRVTGASERLGDITLSSQGNAMLENAQISTVKGFQVPQGGNILISTADLVAKTTSLSTSTLSSSKAGDIRLESSDGLMVLSGVTVSAETRGGGDGGSVQINARQLRVDSVSSIRAITRGQGAGGNLVITVPESVSLHRSLLAVETQRTGAAGTLQITTNTLNIDGTKISTTALPNTTGRGGGIFVWTNTVNILGQAKDFPAVYTASGIFAGTLSAAPAGSINLQPLPGQPTLNINFLAEGAQISAAGGQGPGGDITISAPEAVTLQGNVGVAVSTRGSGNAGQLVIRTGTLNLEGSKLSAETYGSGAGGNILIEGKALTLSQEGQLFTNTFGSGTAGNIVLRLSDRLTLAGRNTGLFSGTTLGSTGNAGSIFVDPQTVLIQDGARITVDSQGQGAGGVIELQAGNLTLDRGVISAATSNSDGGNVDLQVQNLLLLRNNSLISATAGGSGNGGNLKIQSSFVIAHPASNSDIQANAFLGDGGQVSIAAQGLFGLQFRSFNTPESDITATSRFGTSGEVTLTILDADPARGLVSLPTEVVDSSRLVAQTCSPQQQRNSFVVTGRGGLSLDPSEALNETSTWTESGITAVALLNTPGFNDTLGAPTPSITAMATSWAIAPNGTVTLLNHTPSLPLLSLASTRCPVTHL